MKKLIIFSSLMMMCVFTQSLNALSSIGGVTGLIRIPTAEALHYKEISVSYDYIFAESQADDHYYYAVNLGTYKNWELGLTGGNGIDRPEEGVFINAKYYLMSDESRYPVSIAVGAENLGSRSDTGVYMIASKIFQGGLSAHLGFKATFENEITPSLMGGVQYFMTNELAFMGDIHDLDGEYTANAGALYYLTDDIVARASLLDLAETGASGLSYSFGIVFSKYL